jgi:hypothetical protein
LIYDAKKIKFKRDSDGFIKSAVSGIFGGMVVWLTNSFIYGKNMLSVDFLYGFFAFTCLCIYFGGIFYFIYRKY